MNIIIIAEVFTKYPGLRYKSLSPGASGEEFRDDFLIPLLDKGERIQVVLDGNIGTYVPSFLEEAFAGLLRKVDFINSKKEFDELISLVSIDDESLIDDIHYYIDMECKI